MSITTGAAKPQRRDCLSFVAHTFSCIV